MNMALRAAAGISYLLDGAPPPPSDTIIIDDQQQNHQKEGSYSVSGPSDIAMGQNTFVPEVTTRSDI